MPTFESMPDLIKTVFGLVIIVASFVYISTGNRGSMMDNLLRKSKKEFEEREAIREKAQEVMDGKADAFDAIVGTVQEAVKTEAQKQKEAEEELKQAQTEAEEALKKAAEAQAAAEAAAQKAAELKAAAEAKK